MAQEKANYEISRMARLLRVSRSGYYRWVAQRAAGPGPQAARRAVLDQQVRDFFTASDRVYGAPRITADLHAVGVEVNVKTVAASMRRQGLEGICPRMFTPVTTIPGVPSHRIPDRVHRRWDVGELNRVTKELGIDQSMGRTGVCFDNAMSESFFATLKTEFYDRRTWPTRAQARREVARWIEVVYNRRRRHSGIGYATPVDYEQQLTNTTVESSIKDQAA